MSSFNLSISVLKVGRQLAGSLAVAAFLIFTVSACLKEEKPVTPHTSGDLIERSIAMDADYTFQVYYNLEKDSVISRNIKFDWDLAFSASTEGYQVVLNQSKFMSAWVTNESLIERRSDTLGFSKKARIEASNLPDSMAIGDARTAKNVILVDLGYDRFGDPAGLRKLQIMSAQGNEYRIKHSRLDGTDIQTATIKKDTAYNWMFFSFKKNQTVISEPPKDTWDLAFTQYVHQFYKPYQAYLVTGVLLNRYKTYAAKDSTLVFKNINLETAKSFKMSPQIDIIGYDWKSFTNNIYTVRYHVNYIIRNSKGFYYKLQFLDFYDARGTKGSPKFAYQKL